MTERWLPVPGFEDTYEVSDRGCVRSLDRLVWDERGYWKPVRGRMLQQSRTGLYPGVMLHRSPLPPKKIRTHILVLETFVGPRPEGMHGCHYDDNPMNNRLDNLRWDTPRANRMDEIRNGNNHQANKTHCAQGHEYAGTNLVLTTRGNGSTFRICRACRADNEKRYRQRKIDTMLVS